MRRGRGYILVETIVAMAVLSVAILGVHRAISQALTARARTMDVTVARYLLEEVLGDLTLQPELTEGQGQGTFPAPHERFGYSWSIKRVDIPKPEITGNLPPAQREYIERLLENSYVGKVQIKVAWERSGQRFEQAAETIIGPRQLWQPPRRQGGGA